MLITKFISVPRDYSNLNIAAFAAGIIHGVLDAAEFPPEKVTAIAVPVVKEGQPKTVILIKFTPAVISRHHYKKRRKEANVRLILHFKDSLIFFFFFHEPKLFVNIRKKKKLNTQIEK